jgi:rubredoxin
MLKPKDVYDNFLFVLSAWVRSQAILEQLIEKMIQLAAVPAEEGNNAAEEGNNATGLKPGHLEPLPLQRLCPVCFAAGVKTLFLCFDGNFQLRTLKPRGGLRLIESRDLQDCRLFVDKTPTDVGEEKVLRFAIEGTNLIWFRGKRDLVTISRLPQSPRFPNTTAMLA